MNIESMKCPECNSPLHFDRDDQEFCYCSYCGTQVKRTDIKKSQHTYKKIDEARIKEAETKSAVKIKELEYQEKSDKMALIAVFGILILMFIGIGLIFWSMDSDDKKLKEKEASMEAQGYIKIEASHNEFEGKNYEVVYEQLDALGFTNIVTIDLDDTGVFNKKKKGTVESISIAGDSSFSYSDYFLPDDKVVISYH